MTLQRTPLYDWHAAHGGQLIDFGGWELPVKYSGIIEEHLAVRRAAGLFDISHMGEVWVSGPAAARFLNGVLTNDLARLDVGMAQYTILCNTQGGTVDDLYAYRIGEETFFLIINAARIDADMAWLESQLDQFADRRQVSLKNLSGEYAALALQGPATAGFVDSLLPGQGLIAGLKPSALRKNGVEAYAVGTDKVFVARTGYTGEDGFEFVSPATHIADIWEAALRAGQSSGIKPCGLGARDTLRLESCYPLYGHELDEQTSPIEAGLGAFVKCEKGPFVGAAPLAAQKAGGLQRKSVAFQLTGKAPPPRMGCELFIPGESQLLANVSSGTMSPTLGAGIGLACLPLAQAHAGQPLELIVRQTRYPALVVPKPFYRRPTP